MIDTSKVSQEATSGTGANDSVSDIEEDSVEFLSIIDKNSEPHLNDEEVDDA